MEEIKAKNFSLLNFTLSLNYINMNLTKIENKKKKKKLQYIFFKYD